MNSIENLVAKVGENWRVIGLLLIVLAGLYFATSDDDLSAYLPDSLHDFLSTGSPLEKIHKGGMKLSEWWIKARQKELTGKDGSDVAFGPRLIETRIGDNGKVKKRKTPLLAFDSKKEPTSDDLKGGDDNKLRATKPTLATTKGFGGQKLKTMNSEEDGATTKGFGG